MRVGENPLRRRKVLPAYRRHRIIVPVYIPGHDGYFAHALEIFRTSFASLLATVDPEHTAITVIDNASIPEVEALVMAELRSGRIDRYVRHQVNRGKSDPVVGELRASYEPLLTVADCDVLFLHGWQRAIEQVFADFPAAIAVSPSPAPHLAHYTSASTWLQALCTLSWRRGQAVAQADMDQFEASVGKSLFDADCRRSQSLVAGRGGHLAVLGAGHFVITFRRQALAQIDYAPLLEGTGVGDRVVDTHVDRFGGLRLSTTQAHVKHLGNVPEPWMLERLAEVAAEPRRPCLAVEPPWRPFPLAWAMGRTPYVWRRGLARAIWALEVGLRVLRRRRR